jgi:hypothetical protein
MPLLRGLRGGVAAPIKKMSRYLRWGAAGEVRTRLQQWYDLPGRAESNVALHLLDRRGRPSSKEGNRLFSTFFQFIHTSFSYAAVSHL